MIRTYTELTAVGYTDNGLEELSFPRQYATPSIYPDGLLNPQRIPDLPRNVAIPSRAAQRERKQRHIGCDYGNPHFPGRSKPTYDLSRRNLMLWFGIASDKYSLKIFNCSLQFCGWTYRTRDSGYMAP